MPRQKFGPELRPPSVEAWQLAEPLPNTEVATLQGHDGAVLAVRFNKSGTYCLTCGKVRHWHLCCFASLAQASAWHFELVYPVVLASGFTIQAAVPYKHGLLQILLQDRTLKLWNPHRGVLVKTYQGHGHDVRDVAVSADNSK